LTQALDAAERLGLPGFEWVQNGFSLLQPAADGDVRAICRERGLGYTPFSPLAGGVLTGKYRRGEPFPEGSRMALRPEIHAELMTAEVHDALEKLRAAAVEHRTSCGALALAWSLAHPGCTAPVVGPSRRKPHLELVAAALKLKIDADERARISSWFESASRRSS
jgi:aryl-alcohol dehydrogenase-like predicted oxidoreductase